MLETCRPMDIEARSFEIITGLLGDRKLDPENAPVIKRAIHTTADFDYADNLVFSPHAVQAGLEALRSGCDIVTDTQMAKAGINKTILASLGGEVHCFMSDPDVAAEAKSRGVTRAWVSMEKAAQLKNLKRFTYIKRIHIFLKSEEVLDVDILLYLILLVLTDSRLSHKPLEVVDLAYLDLEITDPDLVEAVYHSCDYLSVSSG